MEVLDVAGGKGELAYELLAYGRIKNITIVDPRPYNIFGMLKRLTRDILIAYHEELMVR